METCTPILRSYYHCRWLAILHRNGTRVCITCCRRSVHLAHAWYSHMHMPLKPLALSDIGIGPLSLRAGGFRGMVCIPQTSPARGKHTAHKSGTVWGWCTGTIFTPVSESSKTSERQACFLLVWRGLMMTCPRGLHCLTWCILHQLHLLPTPLLLHPGIAMYLDIWLAITKQVICPKAFLTPLHLSGMYLHVPCISLCLGVQPLSIVLCYMTVQFTWTSSS